nr:hypothetical protein [Accumulibacter sp.]
ALNGLYVDFNAPWFAAFRSELLSFPAGKNDDQVDAIGLVGQLLDQMQAGTAKQKTKPQRIDRWDAVFDDDGDDLNWKTA